jgi:multidrug resistance efflux pump
MDKLPPIPTPVSQRWREFKIQVLPLIIFVVILASVAFLWKNFVAPTGIVGEVEAIKADVISIQDGTVARLNIDRFETVEAGQELGEIISSSEDFLKASVAAIEADLRVMDTRIALDERRNQQSTVQLRMDWYSERAQLAGDKALLIQKSNTFRRAEQEFNQTPKLIADNDYDIAKAEFETVQATVAERNQLVAEMTQTLEELKPIVSPENKDVVEEAIKTKIAEIEETLKPTKIRAPMSGVVSSIYHRPGEKVVRGVPILTITAVHSDRVVGYLRQPINMRPAKGDTVIVSTRTQKRQYVEGEVLRVGTQMELINPALLSTDSNRIEVGLPFLVRIPANMKLVPGEFVDLSIKPAPKP